MLPNPASSDVPGKRKPRKPRKLDGPAPLPEIDYIQLALTPSLENWLRQASRLTGFHLEEAASTVLEKTKDRAQRSSTGSPVDPASPVKNVRLKVRITTQCYDKLKELAKSSTRTDMGRVAQELLKSAVQSETAKSLLSEQIQALQALSEHRASSPAAKSEITERLKQQPGTGANPG